MAHWLVMVKYIDKHLLQLGGSLCQWRTQRNSKVQAWPDYSLSSHRHCACGLQEAYESRIFKYAK